MHRLKNTACVVFLMLGLFAEIFGLYENLAEATVSITPGTNDLIIQAIGYGSVFISADQTIPAGPAVTTVAHGLSGVPLFTFAYIRCTTAELGYSIGDRVSLEYGTALETHGVSVDATNMYFSQNGAVLGIVNRSTGTASFIVNANWKLVLVAWK